VIESAEGRTQLADALEKSKALAEELQAQQEELKTSNEELEEQTEALQRSEEELKTQQEELQVTNEELEEKTESLKLQRGDLINASAELEKRADELARSSKYKSEFLANMSHELRTPLNSLLILANMLMENKEGNLTADQVESAQVIQGCGKDLLSLINEILDLAKIEAGQTDVHTETVSVNALAEETRRGFQHVFDTKKLEFTVDVKDGVPEEIISDGKRIGQILKNLISNAAKFTEAGGVTVTFSIGTLNRNPCLIISVKDTGTGIPKDKQEIVFEAFQQADGSTARKYGGTGLGLSISRELSRILGGEIRLKSEEGKGSVFSLHLPLNAETANEELSTETAPTPKADRIRPDARIENPEFGVVPDDRDNLTKKDTAILVIEDDTPFAKILLQQCHEKGLKCLIASTGEEGLNLAENHLPNAVILDLNLPGIDGWSVLEQLKDQVETRHIPVHVMSAEESSYNVLNNGAIGFLKKPADRDDLQAAFARIEDVLNREMKDLLVIEDDSSIRLTILKLIGDDDVVGVGTATGQEALELLRLKTYDCIILDLNLDDMTGFEFLKQAEADPNITLPPVIVYTGRELTREEEVELAAYSESIIIKGVRSQERLFDETSLFLHRMVEKMPENKRQMIANLHDANRMFLDKKVLIVDDDMRNLFALSNSLASKGIQTIKAQDGQKALDELEKNPGIELVLMDIMMPGMDGYETMNRIRQQKRFVKLPIVALTAKAMKADRQKCIDAGANDYLSKPIDIDRLLSMMRVWMYR
jgi:CheY-like chemotaxis protein